MLNKPQDKQPELSRFLESIDKFAMNYQECVVKEIQTLEKAQIQKVENEIIDDTRALIQKELSAMRHKISSDVLATRLEDRWIISKEKQNMVDKIFDLSKERLLKFAMTSQYLFSIKQSSRKIFNFLGQNTHIFVRNEDLSFSEIIKKVFSEQCEISTDDNIKIGGLRGEKNAIIIDETFDSKLLDERAKFSKRYSWIFD
ncbi:MAG: V-type ATP synthase subunit E [Candidatus Improbicoccus devescovinae]|nr:MAG: V-type ATP synthase subunit E [Candidatus Improbicoccus devescovinae]